MAHLTSKREMRYLYENTQRHKAQVKMETKDEQKSKHGLKTGAKACCAVQGDLGESFLITLLVK